MEIIFTIGDECADGHGQKDSVYYDCSLDLTNLLAAYLKGAEILGFKTSGYERYRLPICQNYGEYHVPPEFVSKLISHGLDPEMFFHYYEPPAGSAYKKSKDYSPWTIDQDSFPILWLEIAKLAEPSLTYQQVTRKASVHIGGYGLFSN